MNDFLQTLRTRPARTRPARTGTARTGPAEKQRTPMTRKNYDQTFHSSSQRYQYANRTVPKFIPPNQMDVEALAHSPLHEAIENLNNAVQSLSQNQKNLVDVQEKTADMLERQVCSIEKILDHLNISSI